MRSAVLSLFAIAASFSAGASPVFNHDAMAWEDKLFYSQVKINQNIKTGHNAGDDVFLKSGGGQGGSASNVDFRYYDANHDLYWSKFTLDWNIEKSDDAIAFQIGDTALNLSLHGSWEGLGLWSVVSDPNFLFDYAYIDWSVNRWNNSALTTPLSKKTKLQSQSYFELYDEDFSHIEQVSGTLSFRWGAQYNGWYHDVPGDHLSFYMKGLDYTDVRFDTPAPVVPIDDSGDIVEADVSTITGTIGASGLLTMLFISLRRRKAQG